MDFAYRRYQNVMKAFYRTKFCALFSRFIVSLGRVRPDLDCKFREKVVDDALPAFPVQHHMDW